MKPSVTMIFLVICTLMVACLSEELPVYWAFNPYFEKLGRKRSPSQGECINSDKIAKRRCSDGIYEQPITPSVCFHKCRCDGGVLYCTYYNECDANTVTSWCRCPDGKDDNDNCLGFMELCYCTPPDGLPRDPAGAVRPIAHRRGVAGRQHSEWQGNVSYGPLIDGNVELNAWDLGLDDDGNEIDEKA